MLRCIRLGSRLAAAPRALPSLHRSLAQRAAPLTLLHTQSLSRLPATAAASAFATRAGTEVTGGAKSGVTCKEQLRDKRQPPPKVSPRIKAPPLKPPPSPLHPHSPHAQVLMVNLHSPVHQVVDTRALPTIAPALRRTNLRVVPVVERVQFRKASKTIATRSIGQKYASTKSVRPGARYASER